MLLWKEEKTDYFITVQYLEKIVVPEGFVSKEIASCKYMGC